MKISWPHEFPGAYWLDAEEDKAVLDVLHNGSMFRYYGLGQPEYADALEKAACEFYGAKFALAVNSGTGALFSAMAALDVGPGCEVILPAFMWVATAGAVVQLNAIPVLCEVDDSFSMDPKDIERKITPRTRLIVAIHMAGCPCDMGAIMEVAGNHGIGVLEDCAQCNGGSFKGKKVGTFGKMGIFSLQLNKNMTCGEGGLVITDDERLYRRAFSAHDMGLVRIEGRLATPEPYAVLWGGGRRMGELQGAVASAQIKKLPRIVDHMRASKRRIKEMLKGTPGVSFRRLNDAEGDTGPFLILVLENERKATSAVAKMKEAGLTSACKVAESGMHIYYNIPQLVGKVPVSSAGNPWNLEANRESVYDYDKGACPASDEVFARSVMIPIPSRLTADEEKQAGEVIKVAVA
jgi:8-amino-3,8-dideoxy-alpha-D-manno-octulosonate transaminase